MLHPDTTPTLDHPLPSPTLDDLPAIPHLRLRARLVSLGDALLPTFKGSLLRGAWGHALRRTVCAMGRGSACGPCPLRRACPYPRLFEPFAGDGGQPFAGGRPAAPRPYLFEPGDERRRFRAGDRLDFELVLLGAAAELASHAAVALGRMGRDGLGARRHRFRLERVEQVDGGGDGAERPLPAGPVALRFVTPTRIKVDGRLVGEVDFPTFVERALRRTLELAHFHQPEVDRIAWRRLEGRLVAAAREVRVSEARFRWHDWRRYSNRQNGSMSLGGFVGGMVLEGDLRPFTRLFRTAEVVHVGKGATFGLGRVEAAAAAL